ncbi:unnamed protein product [Urochloa humidicola]
MDSDSGKNRDESDANQAKEPPVDDVPRPREESKDATAAAAAAPEPPPPAPPSERLQERSNGSPEAGGGRNSSAAAVVAGEAVPAAQRSGTGIAGPSPRGSASVKPQLPPIAAYISRPESLRLRQPQPQPKPKPTGGKPPLPPRGVPASRSKSRGKKPMSHAEVVQSGMAVRDKWRETREGRMGMEEVFNELMEESKAAMPERTATEHEEQVKSDKGSHWRKFLDRVGVSDSRKKNPDVNYETIPSTGMPQHYNLLQLVAGRGVEFSANALNLQHVYSGFRPVIGDGECFYRSFIFNYLEQVLDRQDIHEEGRLLVAAEEVATQHARLGWVDEFSRSHREFKVLIEKVMRWKTNRWNVPAVNRFLICEKQIARAESSSGENKQNLQILTRQFPLPHALLWEILLCLPSCDIKRSMCVCKQFADIIGDKVFQVEHKKNWAPRIILHYKPDDMAPMLNNDHGPAELLAFNSTKCEVKSLLEFTSNPLPLHDPVGVQIQGTCEGTVLLSCGKEFCICNPWTGMWGRLPPIHHDNVIVAFYTCSASTQRNRKDFFLLYRTGGHLIDSSYFILELGSNSFREIGRPINLTSLPQLKRDIQHLPPIYEGPPTIIEGTILWLPPCFQDRYVVTFDTESEVFGTISLPEISECYAHQVLEAEGRLAVSFMDQRMTYVHIFALDIDRMWWVSVLKIPLPVQEIKANRGYQRFGEPLLFVVSPNLDLIVWSPGCLLRANSDGVVQEYHQHPEDWIFEAPHYLSISFEGNELLSLSRDEIPPFFQFVRCREVLPGRDQPHR